MKQQSLASALWLRSSYSNDSGNQCVEVADLGARVGVRDSKDTGRAPLTTPRTAWASFIGHIARRA
ncbi:MAG: DUF397 domain-containing protein [Streptomyces sp.]|uniref:DUF397 domain-containing protein n=1 Tax=Streptomyces sp. TaxID=1931 RepID=UPI003D6B61D4